ncbi:hypothetical protein RSAG8_07174, partial [Rhizoctonia solani AG-8 WAC10335]
MSDPNHPIFKQFTELDPSTIVIRDTPHPDWVWNQPPVMGTLTPGYAQHTPEQPYIPGRDESWIPRTGGSQVQARPQRLLTPGYAQHTPEQPYIPGRDESWIPRTGGSQVQARPQRWQSDFPGLWDDIPSSGTTTTHNGSASSNMPHARPYPLPQPSHDLLALGMGHPEGLAGSAGRLPECQDRQACNTGNGRIVGPKNHRL